MCWNVASRAPIAHGCSMAGKLSRRRATVTHESRSFTPRSFFVIFVLRLRGGGSGGGCRRDGARCTLMIFFNFFKNFFLTFRGRQMIFFFFFFFLSFAAFRRFGGHDGLPRGARYTSIARRIAVTQNSSNQIEGRRDERQLTVRTDRCASCAFLLGCRVVVGARPKLVVCCL